jgi:hypothetical protein
MEMNNSEIPDFIPVKIERSLHSYGWKPYFVRAYPHHVDGRNFNTLKEVKAFFGMNNIVKIKGEKAWAINGRGRKIEWCEYTSEVSRHFIIPVKVDLNK